MKYTEVLQLHKTASDMQWKPNFNLNDSLKWGLGTALVATPLMMLLRRKNGFWSTLLTALTTGALGFLGKSGYDILQGNPFEKHQQLMPKGKDVYIGVTGGGDGKGTGFHRALVKKYGKLNLAMFRWSDKDTLNKFIQSAHKAGKRIHGLGHSYGAATISNAFKNSNVPITSLTTYDPVSWTDRIYKKPDNVAKWVNYMPAPKAERTFNDWIATIGGAWGNKVHNTKYVYGTDHGDVPGVLHYGLGAYDISDAHPKNTKTSQS